MCELSIRTSQDKLSYGVWNGRAPTRSAIRQLHFLNILIFALPSTMSTPAWFPFPIKLHLLNSVHQSNPKQINPVVSGTTMVRVPATNQIKKPSTPTTSVASAPKITRCCSARKEETLSRPQIQRDYMNLIFTQLTTFRTSTVLRFILWTAWHRFLRLSNTF